jgi:hypothetical protein
VLSVGQSRGDGANRCVFRRSRTRISVEAEQGPANRCIINLTVSECPELQGQLQARRAHTLLPIRHFQIYSQIFRVSQDNSLLMIVLLVCAKFAPSPLPSVPGKQLGSCSVQVRIPTEFRPTMWPAVIEFLDQVARQGDERPTVVLDKRFDPSCHRP